MKRVVLVDPLSDNRLSGTGSIGPVQKIEENFKPLRLIAIESANLWVDSSGIGA
jgi:hypothetical protein